MSSIFSEKLFFSFLINFFSIFYGNKGPEVNNLCAHSNSGAIFPMFKRNASTSQFVLFFMRFIPRILQMRYYTEIFSAIICRNSIFMIYQFLRFKRSFNYSFHDNSMNMDAIISRYHANKIASRENPIMCVEKVFIDRIYYNISNFSMRFGMKLTPVSRNSQIISSNIIFVTINKMNNFFWKKSPSYFSLKYQSMKDFLSTFSARNIPCIIAMPIKKPLFLKQISINVIDQYFHDPRLTTVAALSQGGF